MQNFSTSPRQPHHAVPKQSRRQGITAAKYVGGEAEDGRAGTEEAGTMLGSQPYTIKANNKMKVKAMHLFTVACMDHSGFLLLCDTQTGKGYHVHWHAYEYNLY